MHEESQFNFIVFITSIKLDGQLLLAKSLLTVPLNLHYVQFEYVDRSSQLYFCNPKMSEVKVMIQKGNVMFVVVSLCL